MSRNLLVLGGSAILIACWCGVCHRGGSDPSSESPTTAAAAPATTIPSDSPFALIKLDMGTKQVEDLIGPPTDQESHITGKGFNPFHNGDTFEVIYHYKGQGRIIFANPHRYANDVRVLEIQYDPTESGYH